MIYSQTVEESLMMMIGVLDVRKSGHVKEDATEVFITMVLTCPLLFLCKISSPFRENNNVVIFPFLYIYPSPSSAGGSSAFRDSFSL